jgi:hypothetical protein
LDALLEMSTITNKSAFNEKLCCLRGLHIDETSAEAITLPTAVPDKFCFTALCIEKRVGINHITARTSTFPFYCGGQSLSDGCPTTTITSPASTNGVEVLRKCTRGSSFHELFYH